MALPLAACATFGSASVRTIGPGVYAISRPLPPTREQARKVRTSVIKQAKAYCAQKGLTVEVNNEDVTDPATRLYQLTFQCPQGLPEDVGVGPLTMPRPIAVNPKPVNINMNNM